MLNTFMDQLNKRHRNKYTVQKIVNNIMQAIDI